jgi:DegV family protein with EDD domain
MRLAVSGFGIVTDSTSDIPPELAEEWDIHVVPCYINFGTESYLDQEEMSRSEFYERLVSGGAHPTTAAPPAGMFAEAYQSLLSTRSGIISIHPPDQLSALRQSALNGWDLVKGAAERPFRALDAGQLSMGLGWIVVRAAQAARAGADMAAIEKLVASLRDRVHLLAALDTVKYLRLSGRVGWARGTVGKFLRLRPLLRIFQGRITSLGYTRTRGGAIERLIVHLRQLGELESMTTLYTHMPEIVDQFHQRLTELQLPEPVLTVNATPILGTHVGPGSVGFIAIQRQGRPAS